MLDSLSFTFIPISDSADHAMFGWRADIDGKQYGQIYQLGVVKTLSEGEWNRLTLRSVADAHKLVRELKIREAKAVDA